MSRRPYSSTARSTMLRATSSCDTSPRMEEAMPPASRIRPAQASAPGLVDVDDQDPASRRRQACGRFRRLFPWPPRSRWLPCPGVSSWSMSFPPLATKLPVASLQRSSKSMATLPQGLVSLKSRRVPHQDCGFTSDNLAGSQRGPRTMPPADCKESFERFQPLRTGPGCIDRLHPGRHDGGRHALHGCLHRPGHPGPDPHGRRRPLSVASRRFWPQVPGSNGATCCRSHCSG